MATFNYQSITTGTNGLYEAREHSGAASATTWAHRQHARPAGTTIQIRRIRTVRETIDSMDSAAKLRALNPRYVPARTAGWMPYRSYVVGEDGIVRRTDR